MKHTLTVAVIMWIVMTTTWSSAIPPPSEHKSRVIDRPLSDEDHFTDDGIEPPHHNTEFDHEAFLGKDEQKAFENLSPEESKERLGLIYLKIDTDNNGLVSVEELTDWIRHVQTRYVVTDSNRQWKEHVLDPSDTHLKWDRYVERTYGLAFTNFDEEEDGKDGGFNYRDMVRRDKRRWAHADRDNDALLTKEEFADFLHPEESNHMKDIIVDETLEDIDKNNDGSISLEEYIGDMYTNKDGSEEPDWVKSEREQFALYRDKNKDGVMDREEVMNWIIPDDYDHAQAEAKHLIHESDENRDGFLSKEEAVEKYDLFVGSQATDFGEALVKHDEF